jgi:hypothetical protein
MKFPLHRFFRLLDLDFGQLGAPRQRPPPMVFAKVCGLSQSEKSVVSGDVVRQVKYL